MTDYQRMTDPSIPTYTDLGTIPARFRCGCGRMSDGGPEPATDERVGIIETGMMLGACKECWDRFHAEREADG